MFIFQYFNNERIYVLKSVLELVFCFLLIPMIHNKKLMSEDVGFTYTL